MSILNKHILTKSKVMSGLQCKKKLWFDINNPTKIESPSIYIGNRFGEFARNYYGLGLNLNNRLSTQDVLVQTSLAINDSSIRVIYEGAFIYEDTLIRADVLLRNSDGWDLIEIKSSTTVKLEHIKDAAIQAYIIEKNGIKITKVKIGYINNQFIYFGDDNYENLLLESDITEEIKIDVRNVPTWINELKLIASNNTEGPNVAMGKQCNEPYMCQYRDRCQSLLPRFDGVPISIIPYIGKKLSEEWGKKGIHDLRYLPAEALDKPMYERIQKVHKENSAWVDPEIVMNINSMGWPRYFMDFETVQQGIPKLMYTKAYDSIPFQWSVHKWIHQDQSLTLNDSESYLDFYSPDMDQEFLSSLIKALGSQGPIFVHNASYEIKILKSLSERGSCKRYKESIEAIIERIVDTLELARNGFYAPEMMGSFSLKDIVKAIPETVNFYNQGGIKGGSEAQIAWFKCTDPEVSDLEKKEWEKKLKDYCSQDTLAMYYFLKFIINNGHTKEKYN